MGVMHVRDIWDGHSPASVALRISLWPVSCMYAFGWRMYRSLYDLGLKQAKSPHRPIIVVGNLTVGGSGKTPATLAVARVLADSGVKVVVGASGYGSPAAEGATLAPFGGLTASEWGDEPALIRDELGDIPLIVGRARVRAAEICRQHFPEAVLLMDDGFQHLPLKKQISILIDPPGRNYFCLPAGPYREPRTGLERADLVLPGDFILSHPPLSLFNASGELVSVPPEGNVLCALGHPENFVRAVEDLGVTIRVQRLLPDHDRLLAGTLFDGLDPSVATLVTAKDWVKLRERQDIAPHRILIARRRTTIEPADKFAEWILSKIR